MAELVAGAFLSSFFQVILDKLASSNFTDYFRRGKLEQLVEKLESTLDSINQVLDDAEIKQYQIPKVKKWLSDVKHAMYEADQLLDEIATDAPLKKLKAESQPSTSNNNFFGYVSTFINPFESRIKDLLKNLDYLAEQKDVLDLKNETCVGKEVRVSSKPLERLPTSYLVDASSIFGRDGDKGEMIKTLLSSNGSSNQTPIISIVGLGGIGKTTLAKFVYNDNMIGEHFELKAWVYVSESFDVIGLTKAILKSFNSSADGEDLNLLQHQLQHMLMGKKYLLVLDDIWNGNAECWEQLLLPFNHGSSGSKIIVTTREKELAYHVLKSTKLFDLHQLDKINCWSLFVTHAFQGKSVCEYPNLESIGREIVDKCGGLPLAIKSLGQLLRKKFSQDEWIQILETDMWRLSDGDNTINSVLRLSYHNLPSNLKRCFSYCSIFPKGYELKKNELIKLWMAEGLLKCYGSDKNEEDFGNEIFSDLESISFFQKSFYEDFGTTYEHYVMHDLVNDLAKSVSREFCMQIEGVRVEGIIERTRHIQLSFPPHCGDNFLLKKPKGVSNLLEPICELKGLRSLMILQGMGVVMCITNNMQHDIFSRLKCLRMLSFRQCGLSELVDEISNLKLLRYLDLSYTEITSLPDTICMLYNLQTLLLEGCDELTELPSNFSKLINLCHLELPSDYRGTRIKKMPKHMGKLINLKTLSYFIVEDHNGSDLKELAELNHLHGTIHIKGLGNVCDTADAATLNLKDIEELHVEFNGRRKEMAENNVLVLEALQPNSNLKKLNITHYKGSRFPNWLSGFHLPNLISLELKCCGLCSYLPPLGQLPSLKKLSIYDTEGIKIIDEEFYGNNSTIVPFKSLEYLIFDGMVNWEEWICLRFPLLKKLYIRNCPKLKGTLPQHLPSLQKLNISGCKELEEWLCLDGFLSLEELSISNCSKLKRVLPQHLPSLQELRIINCNKLEEWLCLGEFPLLKKFSISDCSKLKRVLPQHLPSLQKLDIIGCKELEEWLCLDEFLSLKELSIINCSKLKRLLPQHLPSLQKLNIFGCIELEEWLCLDGLLSLKELSISDCSKFKRVLPQHFPSLQKLKISGCRELEEWLCLDGFLSLEELSISNCSKLKRVLPQHLPSLQELRIINCNKLEEWLCLGEFPLLKEFSISDCSKFKRVLPQHLHSLQKLKINNCNKLEEWLCRGEFPLLKEISISDCHKWKRALPQHLPSLQTLRIYNCKKLEVSIPRGDNIIKIDIQKCDRIFVNELPIRLKRLFLRENRYTEFSVETNLVNNTILKRLGFDFKGVVNCPSLDLCCYNSLRELSITGWHYSSLPFSLNLFTSLAQLNFHDCPELEPFPRRGMPYNLRSLTISNCPKLIASREEWGLFQLNSLKYFAVSDEFENVESFPEENLLPPSLFSFELKNCSKLRIMNNNGFLHLKSLQRLYIYNCPSLETLPEESLPNFLFRLWIRNCPLIKLKYEKEGGEHWHTISHILSVMIDGIKQE